MDRFQVRLKKGPVNFQLLELDAWPTWDELTSKIVQLFQIPRDQVIITFRNPHGNFTHIKNVGDLHQLYESLQESCRYIKFVVQDSQALDATLSTTRSANSNLSDLIKPESLVCWVLNSSDKPFSVPFQVHTIVDELKKSVKNIMNYPYPHPKLRLWKLTPSIPSSRYTEELAHFRSPEEIPGCIHLPSANELSEYFLSPPTAGHIHIIVQTPTTPVEVERPLKKQKLEAEAYYQTKREKSWHILGAITPRSKSQTYFLDPAQQSQNQKIINSVNKGDFLLIAGARASGKTTQLLWLSKVLRKLGYYCFYITVELLSRKDTTAFWSSISVELDSLGLPNKISSPATFHRTFIKREWKQPIVILIDEMSQMSQAPDDVVDSFLGALRGVRHKEESAIQSVVGAGTFDVIRLSSKNPSISPFNVAGTVQMPYFDLEQTRYLFNSFQQDYSINIESDVIKDIWAKSNGHPGMVCLCGMVVFDNLMSLLGEPGRTLSFSNWQKFPITKLNNEVLAYNTFRRMLISLGDEKARGAVQLYRSRFAGFLEDVEISSGEEDLADFLTTEGVLLRPVVSEPKYHMTSPLIDALVRLQVIPSHFPNKPPSPVRETRGDILVILTEALKCFDKDLIKSAYDLSFKISKVYVDGSLRMQVPRESVYETELMRILCNWLRPSGWSVIGQLYMTTDDRRHKYSDIVIQQPDHKPIVLELVATDEPGFLRDHIEKTLEYMALASAGEGWVIHFTCEDSFIPTWQTDDELRRGVNVIHVSHAEDFTNLKLYIRSKNKKGEYDLSI